MSDQEDAAGAEDGGAAVEAAGDDEGEDGASSDGGHDEAEDEGAAEAEGEAAGEEPGTVPQVELGLHELSVAVTGQHDDDLGDVADTACDLMTFLVDRAEELSDEPDQYGLS